jgi:hypothetical protein
MDFTTNVKLKLYETIAESGSVPTADEVAVLLETSVADVETAFAGLAGKRLLVLEPGETGKIRMAPPFSGVETPFLVRVGEQSYYANCVWDALGVLAALHRDGVVEASDGHTGEPMRLEVRDGKPISRECAIHFEVPAAHWWDDIIHT